MSVRVRVHAPAVERLLRLRAEDRRLADQMRHATTRRAVLREQITRARLALTAAEAQEFDALLERINAAVAEIRGEARRSTPKEAIRWGG